MQYVLLSYFLTLDAILCICWITICSWKIYYMYLIIIAKFPYGDIFPNKLQHIYPRLFLAWLSALDLVHVTSKWVLTPLYVDISLQSQRKLTYSTSTLILFQQSAQNTRSTIFVVTVGKATVALVDMGIITSFVHTLRSDPLARLYACFTVIQTWTHRPNMIHILPQRE